MGTSGSALGVRELNFLQNRLGLGAGFNPSQNVNAAGGFATPADEAALRSQLLAAFSNGGGQSPEVAKAIQGLFGVQGAAAGQPQLANLDPATQASLDAITKANLDKFQLNQTEQRTGLLNDLFGSGTEKSTIALDKAGRMQYGQGALLDQLLADAAQRQLGVRTDVSNRALQNFQLQGQLFGKAGELGLQGTDLRQKLLGGLLTSNLERLKMGSQTDLERQMLLAKLGGATADMQSNRVSAWNKALSIGGSLLGSVAGGPLGGMLGNLAGSIFGGGIPKAQSFGSDFGVTGFSG